MTDTVFFLRQSKSREKIKSLPYGVYFWTVFILALAGMADSLYLSISHYRVYTDMGYRSFCALTKAINCDTVSQSPYSIFLDLPVPVWGVVGYLFFLLLLLQGAGERAGRQPVWALLFLVSLVFSIYSLILAWISSFFIHSYCLMCIVSYGINFGLLFYSWLVLRRFAAGRFLEELKADLRYLMMRRKTVSFVFGAFFIAAAAVWMTFPDYWNFETPISASSFASGITPEGHPWIGAEQPEIEIIEFADYRCFQCRKMNLYLRGLMARYPDKIRVVHRHFPMDHRVNPIVKEPMHVGAGVMTLMAIYAARHDRFWQMHDLLFAMQDVNEIGTRSLAVQVGLDPAGLVRSLSDPEIIGKLREDLREGIRLGITGTPTYVMDGKIYPGQLPPDIQDRLRP